HRPVARRPGAMAEPHRRRVDELLRPVLPVGDVSAPAARQHLPEALGWKKVPTATDLQAVQTMVDPGDRPRARPVRPLAMGPPVVTAGEKSPVTETVTPGSVGAGGCEAPGHPTTATAPPPSGPEKASPGLTPPCPPAPSPAAHPQAFPDSRRPRL